METTTTKASTSTTFGCSCRGMTPADAIKEEAILQEYCQLKPNYWILSEDMKSLKRSFVCKNFKAAIQFINDVAEIAEREDINHHPDLYLTQYRNIDIILFTHTVSGLTASDFTLAKEIEKLNISYSPKWLKEHPQA